MSGSQPNRLFAKTVVCLFVCLFFLSSKRHKDCWECFVLLSLKLKRMCVLRRGKGVGGVGWLFIQEVTRVTGFCSRGDGHSDVCGDGCDFQSPICSSRGASKLTTPTPPPTRSSPLPLVTIILITLSRSFIFLCRSFQKRRKLSQIIFCLSLF